MGDDKPAHEPDLLVVLNEHADRIHPTHLAGVADVVVEIVSPESMARDYGTKFQEYEALGIPEYWLIDPLRKAVTLFTLGADRYYHRVERDSAGQLASAVLPRFAVAPELFWQNPLPDAVALFRLVEALA